MSRWQVAHAVRHPNTIHTHTMDLSQDSAALLAQVETLANGVGATQQVAPCS